MLLVTLFGGILVVIALYFLFGLMRLPHFWRGVLSGALPTMAYVGYSLQNWSGGDVLSMHMAIYMATAVVLTMIMSRKREPGVKAHWAPKAFVIFFAVLLLIMAVLVYISGQGVPASVASWLLPAPKYKGKHMGTEISTAFSGVVHHGEDAAKTIGSYREKSEKERQLGWSVSVVGVSNLRAGEKRQLIATALDKDSRPLHGTVILLIGHPGETASEKEQIFMREVEAGRYVAELQPPQAGNWSIGIRIKADGKVLDSEQVVQVL